MHECIEILTHRPWLLLIDLDNPWSHITYSSSLMIHLFGVNYMQFYKTGFLPS
jgi:hypothetical protein